MHGPFIVAYMTNTATPTAHTTTGDRCLGCLTILGNAHATGCHVHAADVSRWAHVADPTTPSWAGVS